jgi:hypothetical protein
MCFACWITKAINTHKYVILLIFQGNNIFAKAPQYYVTHSLPLLFEKQDYVITINDNVSHNLAIKELTLLVYIIEHL